MKNKINLLCVAFFSLLLAGCEKENNDFVGSDNYITCLLYTSPSPRD